MQIDTMQIDTIIQGDCLAVLRDLPDDCVDAVIMDPPYSSGGLFRGDRTGSTTDKYVQGGTHMSRLDFAGDNRDQRSYAFWSVLWLSECLRVAKPGAAICVFSDWRQLPTMTDALQAGGWVWRGIVVWDKTEAARAHFGRFRSQCEYVLWGSKGAMPLNNGRPSFPGVYRATVRQKDKHHITGKPTDLMRGLVRICEPGGVVLDPFAGSGTTCVAAKLEGYHYIGIEQSREYAEVARRRLGLAEAPSSTPGLWNQARNQARNQAARACLTRA